MRLRAGAEADAKAEAALEAKGVYVIGVDTDWYKAPKFDEFKSLILTSVQKNMGVAIFETIKAGLEGTFSGGEDIYVGTLANKGVGITAFTDFSSKVSSGLADKLVELEAGIIDGTYKPKG